MALPGSGQLSINDIVGEFGGSAPHALSEYYRGGSLVPDSATNSGVPTSGQIKISDFYGAADQLWSTTITNGYSSYADFILTYYYRGFKSGTSNEGSWINCPNIGSGSDTTVNFLSGSNLIVLGEYTIDVAGDSPGGGASVLVFEVQGTHSNTGFTTMQIGGVNYNRTSASYTQGANNARWEWNTASGANPFGTNLSQQTNTSVVFL